jgi:hypothetical protein
MFLNYGCLRHPIQNHSKYDNKFFKFFLIFILINHVF